MRKYLILALLLVSVLLLPRSGYSDSFWLGFGMSSGYGYGGGYYGGACSGYVPAVPVIPVVPYYGGGCSTTTIIHHGPAWGYGPVYHYHYRPYCRNWYDNPYYGPSCRYRPRKYYYGGAYHPAPPPPQYYRGRCRPRRRPRVHINNCNNCNIYGKRRR